MPTISGTVVTFIPYEEAEDELQKALNAQTNETIAKLILEFGVGVVVGKFIKFLQPKLKEEVVKALETAYDVVILGAEIADVLNGDENELADQLETLGDRGEGYALRIETTYSEWISGSGNHSCNYQCENEYSIVLYT